MKIKSLIVSVALCMGLMVPVFADGAQASDQAQIKQISSDTQNMKKQLAELRRQVASLKKQEQQSSTGKKVVAQKWRPPVQARPTTTPDSTLPYVAPIPQGEIRGTDMDRLIQAYMANLPVDWDNPGQSFVSIGPYVNVPIQFSGNNLIINDPKINTDVALLKLRKAAHQGMINKGVHTEEDTHHSHLLLSGNLAGQAQYVQYGQQGGNGSAGNNGSSTNVDLANAELDFFLLSPSPWVSGFMSLTYDTTRNQNDTNSRVLNSRIFLNNAFIILGDFIHSPVYATLGQMFVPFGTYSSVFITSPLTKRFARTKARAILFGYQQQTENAFYTSVYAFKGDSHASATSRINNGGINLGYRFDISRPDISGEIGGGWLANIADAIGMQYTGNQPQFNGFGGPVPYGNEKLVHRVPALNIRGRLSLSDKIDFIGEYIGVTTSFNPNDMTFRARGASPWGFNSEVAYTFRIFDKPTSMGVGYSQAKEALALGLPERRYGAVLNTSIWHNTIQSIEVRHDINYASSKMATGSNVVPLVPGLGTADNVITAEFDVYF
jgi:hypothetical protein